MNRCRFVALIFDLWSDVAAIGRQGRWRAADMDN